MTELYRAGFQLIKVRAWMLIALAIAGGACWYGWGLFQTFGERPADGGVLAPFVTRLLVGGFVALLGLAFAAGMWVYSRVYVASLAWDRDACRLVVRTPGFILTRRESFAPSEIGGTGYRKGRLVNPAGVSVDAPWHSLKIKGRRFGYIIDAQGHWLDPDLARQVLKR